MQDKRNNAMIKMLIIEALFLYIGEFDIINTFLTKITLSITKRTHKMKYLKRILVSLLTLGLVAAGMSGCSKQPVIWQKTDVAMGTIISQTIYTIGKEGEQVTNDIQKLLLDLENNSLSWRVEGSEISQINASAGNEEGYELTNRMERYLETALEVADYSNGAFEPTIGRVVRLWNIDEWSQSGIGQIPTDEEISQLLRDTGHQKVTIRDHKIYLEEGINLDLGAAGKGIACDEIVEYLETREDIAGGVFSIGGNILTYGEKPDKTLWQVGVVNPLNTDTYIGYLQLEGGYCVSTSGDYERYVEVDGVRYHHIIDPATGYPVENGVRSITIISKSGIMGDILSTAGFVAGGEQALEIANHYGVDAIVVTNDGEILITDGIKSQFTIQK